MALKTNYIDDELDTSVNTSRLYDIKNGGTVVQAGVSLEDKTRYVHKGDLFGAADANATNTAINNLTMYFDKIVLVDSMPSTTEPNTLYLSKS